MLKGQDAKLEKILSRSDELEIGVNRIVEGQEKLMEMFSISNAEHEETRSLIFNNENGISKEVQKANGLTNTELSGTKEELTDQNAIFSSFRNQLNATITQLDNSIYEVGSFINEYNQMPMENFKEAKESNASLLTDKM
jgi:uncharacterized protein YdcH (DUF465 family)